MDPRPNQYQLSLSFQKKVSKENFVFSPYCLLNSKHYSWWYLTCQYQISFEIRLVTRTGIEPMFAAWEAAVLTAWPTGQMVRLQGFEPGTHWLRVSCSTNWAKGASSAQTPYPSLPPPVKAHSFRCASSSNQTRFAGLWFEFGMRDPAPWKPNSETNLPSLTSACVFLYSFCRSSPRLISIGQLHASQHFHLRPINDIVYVEPYSIMDERSYLRGSFTLRCFQRLSRPDVATQLCPWQDNWCTRGLSIPVLSY